MTSAPTSLSWAEANQRHLVAALAVVRTALERHADRFAPAGKEAASAVESASGGDSTATATPSSSASMALADAAARLPAPSALESLCAAFRLSPFERDILLLCAGGALDAKFAAAVATAQGDPRRSQPTFGLALAALPEAHWSALAPDAPLRYWRLIELGDGDGLTTAPLRIDERILHGLAGVPHLDERLQPLLHPVAELPMLTDSQAAVARRLAEVWLSSGTGEAWPVIQLSGADADTRQAIAAAGARELGLTLFRLAGADVPPSAADRDTFRRLWERETVLGPHALLVEVDDHESAESLRGVRWLAEHVRGAMLISCLEPLRELGRTAIRLEVARPTIREQRALWLETLGPQARQLNGELDVIVQQFQLGPAAIRAAVTHVPARPEAAAAPADPPLGRLWDACRVQCRARLDDLAQRIEPAADWNGLVLPEPQLRTLREIATHLRHRATVYERWGFAGPGTRGLGISALFAGPSGTGKTMAAEVLAAELRLDLYRIDLSQVVSKYIGETEKNLRRVFDAAETGGAILLFDEADALFGKRSEVKDSHDRYANIEVGYLLQRMEAYRGLAILTTNLKQALDPAFLRRLRFVVQFPFPDAAQRAEIWRRVFPAATPTEGLDPAKLARLNVAGGNIRNIALGAAFLAAEANEPVRMTHLERAARSECAKLERPATDAELGGWR